MLQGATELFPISSLGHSVVLAWVFNWNTILVDQSKSESFFLSLLVVMHVATATALLIFYRKTWVRIIKGFFDSLKTRKADTPDARLAWLLILATIPAGITGLALEHILRTQFAKPLSAIVFLAINGLILLYGERFYKKDAGQAKQISNSDTMNNISKQLTVKRSLIIGVAQTGALFAGISRSGITMVSGLMSGLSHEDAARFSFLLATPIIFAAGVYKLPDLLGPLDTGVHGQIFAGGIAAGLAAYAAVKFLDKYFVSKTLKPFGIYCLSASGLLLILGLLRGHF